MLPGVVADGVVSWTAFENVAPRSREIATMIFPLPFAPLKVVHIAYTWSRFTFPKMWLTAIHCLSSTWPNVRLFWLFVESRARPPFPFTQFRPRSSE